MTTKMIELEFPFDSRRKGTIITDDKEVCEYMSTHPDAELSINILERPVLSQILEKIAEIDALHYIPIRIVLGDEHYFALINSLSITAESANYAVFISDLKIANVPVIHWSKAGLIQRIYGFYIEIGPKPISEE